ncbi:MAG: DUF882 domain-containing protein [Rhodobacteraceae bacterium]|nr:DUF882 domain-containing protein [Paracoccaceae bacterium]MCY4198074.1 DUF882 domain-containing protein [Paracoccaceae bacterium]
MTSPRSISRRTVLGGLAASGAALAGWPSVAAPPQVPPRPPAPHRVGTRLDRMTSYLTPFLDMHCPATQENWQGFFAGAADSRGAQYQLDWFLRDWRERISVTTCPRLFWGLAAIAAEALTRGGSGRVTILSGYRTPRTNAILKGAAPDSFHMYGRAVDFRIDGLSSEETVRLARHLEIGGVGRYPVSDFTHIDSGRVRTWQG